ncbi:hypothetical protein PGB90_007383 [Kerria lacca]
MAFKLYPETTLGAICPAFSQCVQVISTGSWLRSAQSVAFSHFKYFSIGYIVLPLNSVDVF